MTTFTNIFQSRVMSSLVDLFSSEHKQTSIYHDYRYQTHGSDWVNIIPKTDTFIGRDGSQIRQFTVEIRYYRYIKGIYTYENHFLAFSKWAEQVKQMLENSSNYNRGGADKFYNGTVESINYEQNEDIELGEDQELPPDLYYVTLEWTCFVQFHNTA